MADRVELLYFDGCPSWQTARDNLEAALKALGIEAAVTLRRVETPEEAEAAQFVGSPTLRVDGRDLFPTASQDYTLSCRVYHTPDGLEGWPTVGMIEQALAER